MIQNIDKALQTIKSTMYHHKNSAYYPYFFIVGAGISVPEIPAASKIIDICKDTVREIDSNLFTRYEEESNSFADNSIKYYSSWIEYAYPNRINRSHLFKDLCSKSKISSANLMLAQILNSREFANTVFTTNFDDSLKKALDLMGTKNYFCAENIMDNLVISNQTKDIQIIHVHGTFNFYDCANLEKEIDNIASQSGTISSARVLSSFLSDHAPIIVGYSGWENDVIMRCLKERLTYPTPLQYIWICYDKNSYSRLPEWIKKSDSVIFVIPESDAGDCGNSCDTNSWDNTGNTETLDATMFFKRIISDLKLKPPLIFTDPHQYYSKKIKSLLPKNEDVLHLQHWTQRLKILESNDVFEKLVQKLEASYIAKDYVQANTIILEMSSISLNEANAEFVCTSLIKEFIRDEGAISSFEQRLNFHLSSLQFIQNNLHQLSNTQSLISTLRAVLFTRCRYSDMEKIVGLFDKTIELAKSDSRLLLIELTALAMKSDLMDQESRKTILKEVISRCPDISNNQNFAYLKYKALCELSSTICSIESVSLIENAEQIIPLLNDNTLNISICLNKSKLLPIIKEPKIRDKWFRDVLNVLSDPLGSIELEKYIEIASNLSFIEHEHINQFSKEYSIEKIITNLLQQLEVDQSNCHLLLHYANCCELICSISSDPQIIVEYSQKIFDVASFFPHECKNFLATLKHTAMMYFLLPETLAEERSKISILQTIKETQNTNAIFYDLLEYVYSQMLICDTSAFLTDIAYIQEQNDNLSNGYDLYCNGNHAEAERIFVEALSCKVTHIANSARTNLAYMVRRNEAKSNLCFEEIMQQKTNLTGFDFMNILLFYKFKDETENEKYQKAKNSLAKLSEDERDSIISWWSNINLVGEYESKIALSFIKSA